MILAILFLLELGGAITGYVFRGEVRHFFCVKCQGMGDWAQVSVNVDFYPPWSEIKIY